MDNQKTQGSLSESRLPAGLGGIIDRAKLCIHSYVPAIVQQPEFSNSNCCKYCGIYMGNPFDKWPECGLPQHGKFYFTTVPPNIKLTGLPLTEGENNNDK